MITMPNGIRRGSTPEIRINKFGGSDYSKVATQIADNQSADMENIMLDTFGMIQQIPGYRKVIEGAVSVGTTPVRMLTRNSTSGEFIKSHGGNLYAFTPGNTESKIYSGIADARMREFDMGGHQYYHNGTDYLRWTGARLTFADNSITTSGESFDGFEIGDTVVVTGCVINPGNNKTVVITAVAEKTLTFADGTFTAGVEMAKVAEVVIPVTITFTGNTITTSGADFPFQAGHTVTIAGCSVITENNKTAKVVSTTGSVMTFASGTFIPGAEEGNISMSSSHFASTEWEQQIIIKHNSIQNYFYRTNYTFDGFVPGDVISISGSNSVDPENKNIVATLVSATINGSDMTLTFPNNTFGKETLYWQVTYSLRTSLSYSSIPKAKAVGDYESGIEEVESVAFIPTTVINRTPTGGGVRFEDVNLLQPKRKNSFVGTGSLTTFQLDTIGLDSALASAVVGGTAKYETTDFTVNRSTGQVTFTSAPADGSGVDNVIIEFSKTVPGYADRIKKCTISAIYGVGNNLRVFMSGNPNYVNTDWQSAMQDPTYFPDLGYTQIGSAGVPIKGYVLQSNTMGILKEESTVDSAYWVRTTATDVDGKLYFPVQSSASSVELVATDTVRIINDAPVMLSRKGIYQILTTNVQNQSSLRHISDSIDAKLLKEENLENAVAFDHDGKYGVVVNDNVYVLDYNNGGETYIWRGIPGSCFLEYRADLYFGDSHSGNVYIMNKIEDANDFDGIPISSHWYSKMFSMDRANFYKMIDTISVTLVPITSMANVDIYYRTDKRAEKFIKRVSAFKFGLNLIDADNFSLVTSDLPQTINREVNVSDIVYFQVILKNSEPSMGMAVSNVTIPYSLAGEI